MTIEKVATSNIKYTLKDKAKRKIVRQAVNEGVTVLGTQEVRDVKGIFPDTWATYEKIDKAAARENKISWDSTVWEFLGGRFVKASDSNVIPAATRYVSAVLLRHRETGEEVWFVNFHTVAHIERAGRPGWTGKGRLSYLRNSGKVNPLIAVYDEGMNSVVKLLKELKDTGKHVVFLGDLNVDAKADARVRHPIFPYRRLTRLNFVSIFMAHGYPNTRKRLIDQIWVLKRAHAHEKKKTVRIVTYKFLKRVVFGQDHKTVVAKIYWQ